MKRFLLSYETGRSAMLCTVVSELPFPLQSYFNAPHIVALAVKYGVVSYYHIRGLEF